MATDWIAVADRAPDEPRYFCIKCGYGGPVQVGHQRPNGTGECDYMAALMKPTPGVKGGSDGARPWPFTGCSGPLCVSDTDEHDAAGDGDGMNSPDGGQTR